MSEFNYHPWPGSLNRPQPQPYEQYDSFDSHNSPISEPRMSEPRLSEPTYDTRMSECRSMTPPPDIDPQNYRIVSDTKHLYSPASEHCSTHASWPPPETMQPGLEPVWIEDTAKEVAHPQQFEYVDSSQREQHHPGAFAGQAPYHDVSHVEKPQPPQQRKKRRRLVGILVGVVVAVVIALALGLGLGLGLKKKSSPSTKWHSGYDPAWFSTEGAFNGSGIAIASQSFAGTNYGTIVLYFQSYDGTIRYMQLLEAGNWIGGDESTIVTSNAKNATPISAVSYALDNVSTWHIFYIDTNNMVRERINSNATNVWIDGPINKMDLEAVNDPNVGLQACWYGNFYGTSDWSHSPVPVTGSNVTSALDQVVGMHLWYGTSSTTIDEVQWTYNEEGNNPWVPQGTFPGNGHAGIACYSWGPGSISYFMNVNLDNQVQVMWKDLNPNATSTDTHPIGQWVNSSAIIDDVFQNSSLGYTNYFYLQGADNFIRGYNISWDAENTYIVSADNLTVGGDTPLPGTHMSVTTLKDHSGGYSIVVFNQVQGTDISEFTRDMEVGQWTSQSLPVPED